MAHEGFEINPIGARHDHQARGVLVIRLVAQIRYHGQLARLHLLRDLLQHTRARYLVRQRVNHDIAVLLLPDGTQAQAAAATPVHGDNFLARRDDLCLGRKIRRQHMFAKFFNRRLWLFQ